MPLSLSTRIAAAKRMVRRIEANRPFLPKRIAHYNEAQRNLVMKTFEDSLRSWKAKLDELLAEQGRQ
jgi:hypothetical protein